MMNREKERCLLSATRLAISNENPKWHDFGKNTKCCLMNSFKFFASESLCIITVLSMYMKCPVVVSAFLFFYSGFLYSQREPDRVYMEGIRTVKLFQQNDQQSVAMIRLGSADLLELHFDDLMGYTRNYFYTYQLCNADWTPALLNPFDYIKGFTQNRLTQYRMSSIAMTKYMHYQALLPERNCMPSKSGNYLLKVFLDGDTARLAFTKRILVVDDRVSIGARISQPFNSALVRTHQKIQVTVGTRDLNIMSPQQQTKLVIIQNNRWQDAAVNLQPTFMRGNALEYNGEQDAVFAAGKEYRWADLRSFRFESDRVEKVDRSAFPNHIFIKPDLQRNDLRYAFFNDRNGWNEIATTESINPWWQGDYAKVDFTLVPAGLQPYAGKDVFLVGEMTGNQSGDSSKMEFDTEKGVYRKTVLLKQGYYSYQYLTKDKSNRFAKADPTLTEGNYWETENEYLVLFYFRPFSGRHDELLGVTRLNSRNFGGGF